MPQLNPVTRTRLMYIDVCLLVDAVVALYVSAISPPTAAYTIPAIIFGFGGGIGFAALTAFLAFAPKGGDAEAPSRARSRQ